MLRLLQLADFLLLFSADVVTLNSKLSRQRAQHLLLDSLAGTPELHLLLTRLLTHTWMAHLLTAMATAQLFGTLVVAGAQGLLGLLVGCGQLRALHVEQADLAVAPLADHLAAGGAGAWVTGAGAGVRAAGWAGLRAALLTHLAWIAVNQMTLSAAGVVAAGQRSSAGSLAGETTLTMTRHRADLVFSKTGRR